MEEMLDRTPCEWKTRHKAPGGNVSLLTDFFFSQRKASVVIRLPGMISVQQIILRKKRMEKREKKRKEGREKRSKGRKELRKEGREELRKEERKEGRKGGREGEKEGGRRNHFLSKM
jgi:hypothetical protein